MSTSNWQVQTLANWSLHTGQRLLGNALIGTVLKLLDTAVLCRLLTDHSTSSVTAVLPSPGQRCGTVCQNSFGNRTSPSDNSNDCWKHLCLVSWAAASCVWTLTAPTRNLLTCLPLLVMVGRRVWRYGASVLVVGSVSSLWNYPSDIVILCDLCQQVQTLLKTVKTNFVVVSILCKGHKREDKVLPVYTRGASP